MSFGEAIKSVFSKYATFSGRARRSEFWYFFLFNFLVSFVLGLIPSLSWVSGLWALAVLIPSLAVMVRRFHDTGKSGWYYLVPLIPALAYIIYMGTFIYKAMKELGGNFSDFSAVSQLIMENPSAMTTISILGILCFITVIIWIVWMAKDSQPGENKWGPNPKELPGNEPQNLD